jgi:SAM-dependent methyltransferase
MTDSPSPALTESTYYYSGITGTVGDEGVWDFADRWPDVQSVAEQEFRSEDRVLDIGCAEGLVTMEVAKRVGQVDGVEVRHERVEAAKLLAKERGVGNVTFRQGSVAELDLPAQSYDVVLFLGVFHHLSREEKWPSLVRVFNTAKRVVIMRTPLLQAAGPGRITNIINVCEQLGFSIQIFPHLQKKGGNLMIAHRLER